MERIERGLHLVPRYRQKLAFPPFGLARPLWVDDPHFNARYHVRHTALPDPAGDDQLRSLAGRVFAQQLDRDKPLWEIWLVDTMADGRFALICKTHHALVDGDQRRGHHDRALRPRAGPAGARARAGVGAAAGAELRRSCSPRRWRSG